MTSRSIIIFLIITVLPTFAFSADPYRPLVGITSAFQSSDNDSVGKVVTSMAYVNAVLEVGGTPVVLPAIRSLKSIQHYVNVLDGLVLVGGRDIPPSVYGEKAHETVDSLSYKRFSFEYELIKKWIKESKKPIFGICLGCQFTNVVCGGSLIQDIPSQIGTKVIHRQEQGALHNVQIDSTSRLFSQIKKSDIVVNSFHHQAVKDVGHNLFACAHSNDGLVEALEFKDRFGLFVQWHPERMETEHRQCLFQAFVSACTQFRESSKK